MNSLLVMLGGAIGSLARYQFGRLGSHVFGTHFPYGTLGVNVIGGLLMGLLAGWLARFGSGGGEQIRLLVGVGLLGGFTTFSAYTLEVVLMVERGQALLAAFYAIISVLSAVAALFAGLLLMRSIAA